MRGVPDVGYQASSRTGVLVYDTAPGDAQGGLICPAGNPCSAGWYVVGGTSASCPQWAGLVAIADQIAGHGLGLINPTLYALASGPNYGTYFYDVTTGNNQADPSHPRLGPLGDYTGQAPGFHCAASHFRSVSSLVRASCSRAKSASVLVRTSV